MLRQGRQELGIEVHYKFFCRNQDAVKARHDMFLQIQHLMSCLEIRITPTWGHNSPLENDRQNVVTVTFQIVKKHGTQVLT